jgi:hypothetical protein
VTVRDRRARRHRLLGLLGLVAVAGLAAVRLAALARAAPTDFDDAYMYLRYAIHLLAGQGLAWNAGEGSVYGVTSLLHLAVVVFARAIFPALAPAAVLQTASGGAAVGFLAALVGIAALCSHHPRLHRNWVFWTAVVLPLVAFREAFGFHASSGMDTMVSALANAVLVFCSLQLAKVPNLTRALWAALAALLAVFARPDNLLCALACPVLAVVLLAPQPNRKPLAAFTLILGGVLVALALAEWRWLGSPLPLSFFAKQPWYYGGFAGEFGWNPFLFLKVFGLSAWPFVVALVLFTDRAGLRRAVVLLLPALATMLVLFRFNQIMGHLGRFYFPFLPFFFAAGALEFDAWLGRIHAGRVASPATMLWRAGLAAGVVFIGSLALSIAADRYSHLAQAQQLVPTGGFHTLAQPPLPDLDSWQAAHAVADLAAASPAHTSFAMSEHGLPGALAPQVTIVDVLGLHDPYFAHHGFSAAKLFRRQPDVIWLPHADHTQMLWEIFHSDDFWGHYEFYPDAFFHGIALRTDSPSYAKLAALLSAQWQKTYPGFSMADYRAERGD